MTAKRTSQIGPLVVIALSFLVGAAAYPSLPADALDNKLSLQIEVAFALPATVLVLHLLFRSLWRHDRIRTGNGAFEATYHAIVFRTMVFVLAMHALLMLALTDAMNSFGSHTWGKRVVVVMFGLLFIAVGNLLPRTRPNIALGLRTKRTLANLQVWQQVHRVSGYVAVLFGAVTTIAALAVSRNLMTGVMSLSALLGIIAVFVSYRRAAHA
jgi:uncharacterized membrane protein